MKQTFYALIFSCFTLLLFCNLQCENELFPVYYQLKPWSTAWLDNSGSSPVIAENPLPREAFGIQLSAILSSDGQDTIPPTSDIESYLEPNQPIQSIKIFAVEGFDDVAAGTDISARFRVRRARNKSLEYQSLENAGYIYNFPDFNPESLSRIDLLMVEPPKQAGAYQFSAEILFVASTPSFNADTLITLPTVVLQ